MPDTPTHLTRAAIDQMDGQQKAHFLNPNARCRNVSLGDATGLTGFGIHIMEVPPGCDSTEPHVHYREDECVFILSGSGTAQVGDDTIPVAAGDFLAHPKGGARHKLTNTGDVPLRCLTVGERHDTDIVDYPEQGKRMFRTKGLDWNVVDLADIKDRPKPKR